MTTARAWLDAVSSGANRPSRGEQATAVSLLEARVIPMCRGKD